MAEYRGYAQPNAPKPAFTVQELEGEVEVRTVRREKIDEKVSTFVYETRTEPAGYMVHFPKGHSIRVANYAELKRMGFDGPVPVVNDEGDEVGMLPNPVRRAKEKV
jgi:hypothetical protein